MVDLYQKVFIEKKPPTFIHYSEIKSTKRNKLYKIERIVFSLNDWIRSTYLSLLNNKHK